MAVKKKKRTSGKKRTLSAKQKAALARGRKKAAANRRRKNNVTEKTAVRKTAKRKTAKRKPTAGKSSDAVIIINQGDKSMARKKRRRTVATRKTSRRRSRGRYMSGMGGSKAKKVQNMLMSTAVSTASAIGGTMLIAKIPVQNPKIKSALPLVAGLLLGVMAKGKHAGLMNQAASGLLIAGGLSVVKQFAPQFTLAGENEMYHQSSLMGINTDLLGINSDLNAQDDYNLTLDQF
jgi:hypothetical protein